ncbi:hypothetical protein, variant 1 [Aphanomyces astaci]|uniref:HECT domain-containing protein n=1 Tax=Aphanomyces astaci TaxID=112090 RepID=W4H5E9_APHAT|nr:hypothetical protein, variant 1 [Aphanomyces astaci]ETV87117.1 hypothetical protein, variant 1 [Aphanomyces astaci]|eukprot:XP_009823917.1 hypothetical protein, variant 1 [Aphanomyces astaci]
MEITLLTSAQYVDDHYKELKRKRPDEKDLDSSVEDKVISSAEVTSAARRLEVALQATSSAINEGTASSDLNQKRHLAACLHQLEGMWPVTPLDKKLTLLFTILTQMSTTVGTISDLAAIDDKVATSSFPATTLESLPLSTQLAVKLFFRLIQSMRARSQASGNYATLLRLVHHLPRMLTDLPPLALSPEQRLLTNDKSIFDELVTTVQHVIPQTKEDQEAVLATLVGLSIKRGRLLHILGVVRLLLQADPTLPMQLALPFLHELAEAKAQETENGMPDERLHAGYLMSFGKGDHGKLGHGTCTHVTCADNKCTENKPVPTMLEASRDTMFIKIDSLSTHSVAVTVAGELYTWGNGEKFRLGHGDATKEYVPRLVEAFRDKPRIKDVACGLGHTVVLTVSGDVYGWGNGGNGRLGLGDTGDQSVPMQVTFAHVKSELWGVGAVYCGASHTLAITMQGQLYTWGKNNQGQCGHGHTNDQLTPAQVLFFDEMDLKVASVAGGWEHTLICTTGGQAFACGCGYKDSRRAGLPPVLGVGMNDTDRRVKPALIPVLENCVAVACGWDHSLAVTGDGSVYSWGSGSNGKLGHGDEDNRDVPTKIQGLNGKAILDVKAGCEHTTAITTNGEMYTWGHSDSGRLGHGDNITRKLPCFVEAFAWQGYRPVSIAVGDKYNLVLVQPVAEKPPTSSSSSSNNQGLLAPPHHPKTLLVEAASLDESMPLTAASLAAHIMTHVDRLGRACMPQDNVQLLEKLRHVYLHPTSTPPAMAYAVDVSNETFLTLVDIITTTLGLDPVESKQSSVKTTNQLTTNLLVTSLRLVQVNLYRLLTCPKLAPPVVHKLFILLRELATLPVADDTQEISQCAADALKIGFQVFYPTSVDQHELLWQLMTQSSSDLMLLRALVDRLCQDYVMVDLMARLFSKTHTCDVAASEIASAWDKDSLTYMDLMALMTRLVKQCADTDNTDPRLQLQLKLVAVLQSHVFAAWNPSMYCTRCINRVLGSYLEGLLGEGLSLLRKVHKGLLKGNDVSQLRPSFFHVLVPLAIECIQVTTPLRSNMALAKTLLPLLLPMLKLVDEITYKMSEDSKANNQALPIDIAWITELENACARLVGRYICMFLASPSSFKLDSSMASVPTCIQFVCRHGPFLQAADPHDDLLRTWESNHVYDVSYETHPPEPVPTDVTLVDHLAILDWVAGHGGVVEDFHQYMLRHVHPIPATTVDVVVLAIVVWHSGLLPSVFACIASIGAVELRRGCANHPPPQPALLHVWQWVLTYCAGTVDMTDTMRMQGKVLLQFYPSKCNFTVEPESNIPVNGCHHPTCTIQPTTPATVSLPQLVTALSRQHFDMGPSTTRGTPLKIIGLSILHDSLCKLTSSSAKCELLRAFIEPVECGGDMGGWLTLTVNAWQEPKVEFHRNAVADVDDVGLTPLQVLEQDMHTQYGVAYHSKLSKAFENLYIRLAKIVASPESSLLLKKRALNLWSVTFHDAPSVLRHTGILHTLGQLLQHEAAHVALAASPPLDILDDAISSSTHGVPSSSCLAPRLRPVEKLVYMATSRHNVHQACWHVFSWLCKQFMTNEQFMANDYDSAMSSDLRPSSSAKAVVCASPRKRLTLPPKLIVSTMEESFDHMVLVLLQEAAKIKDALTGWNHHATELTRCVNASHVLLLADPYVVSSAPAIFTTTSPKEERAHDPRGWTVCMWIHVDEIGAVPVVLVANGDAPLVTLEHHGYIGLTWNDSMIKVVSTGALKRRGWTHVACNFFPDKAELYLNGVLDTAQVGQHYHVVMHPTFTVGGLCGDQSANQPEHHSSSHILLDDVTVHYTPLNPQQIGSLAAAGSLLFRIKQRQLLDQHCTSLLSLLAWLATVKAPSMTEEIPLLLALLPLCPPPAHPHIFRLLACILPSISPSLPIPALSASVVEVLVSQFGLAWFSESNGLYGPPELYDLLTCRKDSSCISTLLRAGLFDRDGGGVVTWLGLDGPLKAKSSSMLRAARSSLVDSFVTLFRALLLSPTWTPELLSKFAGHSPETILVPRRRRSDAPRSPSKKPNDLVVPLILSIYVLGGVGKPPPPTTVPPPVKMGDTMHGLLEWVLQHPLSIDGHGTTFMQDMDEDIQIAIYMHIRASLLRLAMAQTLHPCVARTMLSHESVVTELLAVAVRPVQSSLEDVFGNELDVVSKLDNVQGLVDWIADDNNSNMTESVTKKRAILDTVATILFERLPYVRGADVTPWWVVSAAQSLHVLGGEVEVDEYCVKGLLHFPTVKLNGVSVTAGSGMWYYEVVLLSDGLMQIGWIDSGFESDALQGQGVGDHANSWAFDGFRRKKWNVGAMDYGEKWQSGDVVGVLLDTDRCEMHYFLNGRSLGIAFEGLRLNHPVYPAMSLNVDQSVQFHFTASQFLYLPAMDKIQPVSSAILGHMCEHNTSTSPKTTPPSSSSMQEQDARRTDLIDGLIGLGFPPEWALRCARETSTELSESGAIAWIMEQMEQEGQAVRPPPPSLHGFDTSSQHLQTLDGFTDVVKSPALDPPPPSTSLLCVSIDDKDMESTNPFLADEVCEDAYSVECFSPPRLPPPTSSPNANPTDKKASTFVLELADTCRDEEILPLYLIAETARSKWCAQDTLNQMLVHSTTPSPAAFPHGPFLAFVQSVIVGRSTDDDVDMKDSHLGANYTRLLHAMCAKNARFVSILVDEMLRHFTLACDKDYWYTSFRPGDRATSVSSPFPPVNLDWSCWLARVLFAFAHNDNAAEANAVIRASNVWPTLVKAATNCNATLRHRAITVMTWYLQQDGLVGESGVPCLRFEYFVEWLAARVRKESPMRVVYSDYTQSLFQLVVTIDTLLAATDISNIASPPPSPPSPPLSDLVVEYISTTNVTISYPVTLDTRVSHFQLATQSLVHGRLSPFNDVLEPPVQPGQVSYTFSDLEPDTLYSVRAILTTAEPTGSVTFETLCESHLELDASSMGANLELVHHNMTVRNRVNKKWNAVRASVAYTSGVHVWDVRIDKCVSKNIFVGICTADASMENYVGSDAWGWGFLANKAVWHNKSKLQTYGDMFKQGDVITVALDVDHGTLSFARNGESFGVGVDNLPSQDQGGYFPAISMYNKDDQVTFLPHDEATTGSKGAKSGIASIMRKVEAFQRLQTLWTRQEPPLDVYSAWVLWTIGQLKYVVGADGNAVAVDVTDNACAPFGLQPCDVVFTPKGMCTVLGVAHHLLWYALESHNQPSGHVLAHWNVQTCRDMQSREHEFPITRHHRTHHSHDAQAETPICDIVSYDDFAVRQRSWTPALDEALIARLHSLAQLHRVDSMFHLTAKEIVHALEKHALDGMSAMDCLCRTGVFHASNQLLHAVIPYLASSSGAHGIPRAGRHSCIVGLKFARDLIKKSTTLTLPPAAATDDDVDNDPVDLPKCKLTLPSMYSSTVTSLYHTNHPHCPVYIYIYIYHVGRVFRTGSNKSIRQGCDDHLLKL